MVASLLEEFRLRGITVAATDGRLAVHPASRLTAADRVLLADHRAALLAHLAAGCPGCGRPTDAEGRCWGCHDRPCRGCGRPTGSAFIAHCWPCGLAFPDEPPAGIASGDAPR